MPGVGKLLYCFVNPFASSPELIAIAKNTSNRLIFVIMDANGQVLKKKESKSDLGGQVEMLLTVKDSFIVKDCERSSDNLLRFQRDGH